MASDVAIRERTPAMVRLSSEQLQYIAHTEFVPKSMRGKLPAILACVAMGRELGLGDMVALNTIHVIDGRTSLSAEAMVGLVRKRGHSITGNFSGDSCTVTGKRHDNGDEITVTWTKEMAQDAGLLNKDNYRKYRSSMLWARGVSQLCRMLFADCFAGATYTPEEIAEADFEDVSTQEFVALEPAQDSAGGPQTEETTVSTVPAAPTPEGDQPSPAETPSAAQIKKLNVLVGTLREAGKITTEDVYEHVNPGGDANGNWPRDENGVLHWSPLRDSLTKTEASTLIEWLTGIEAQPAGIPLNDLVTLVNTHQIDHAAMTAAIGRLFPGRGRASELSDVERGVLWGEVSDG